MKAVDAYRRGFEADWREVYPGVNAVTLLEVKGDPDALSLKERLSPSSDSPPSRSCRAPNRPIGITQRCWNWQCWLVTAQERTTRWMTFYRPTQRLGSRKARPGIA